MKKLKVIGLTSKTRATIRRRLKGIIHTVVYMGENNKGKKSKNDQRTFGALSESQIKGHLVDKEERTVKGFKIVEKGRALKGYTRSFVIEVKNEDDPALQLVQSRDSAETILLEQLQEMKGYKLIETLELNWPSEGNP